MYLPGILVEFALAVGIQIGVEGGLGLGEIVIVLGDLADPDLLGPPHGQHHVHILPEPRQWCRKPRWTGRAVDEGRRLVGQHQRVLVGVVLEEIEDAFVFEQPGDEVEIGLAVLDAVLAGLIGAGAAVGEIGKAAVRETPAARYPAPTCSGRSGNRRTA